jgi:hypothetical protein
MWQELHFHMDVVQDGNVWVAHSSEHDLNGVGCNPPEAVGDLVRLIYVRTELHEASLAFAKEAERFSGKVRCSPR